MSEFLASVSEPHVGWPHHVGERFEATIAAPVKQRGGDHQRIGTLIAIADVSSPRCSLRDVTDSGTTGEAILGVRDGEQYPLPGAPAQRARSHDDAVRDRPHPRRGDAAAAVIYQSARLSWRGGARRDRSDRLPRLDHGREKDDEAGGLRRRWTAPCG